MRRSAVVIAATACLFVASVGRSAPAERDWVVVYWMCYDNNLEGAGRPILDMLGKGVRSERVAVVVAADFRDDDGMVRFVLTDQGETKEPLPTEGSTDPEVLAAQLAWVAEQMPAKRYGIVFVNHGGAQSKSCFDEHPAEGLGGWLEVPDIADVLEAWRRGLDDAEVELLFMQQCGKGSLENHYELRGAARFVMASQTLVGAPNYYYTEALAALSADPLAFGGEGLAKLFMAHETANMFTDYTATSSEALAQLPGKLDAVLAPLFDADSEGLPPVTDVGRVSFSFAPDEGFVDLIGGLTEWYGGAKLELGPVKEFATWVETTLIAARRVSSRASTDQRRWSGLSILLATPRARRTYRTYDLYVDSRLDEWMERLGVR